MDANSSAYSIHRGEERGMDTFNISGPRYLTSVDWKNAHHRRAVAASLVKGVYVLEKDCQKNVQGADALAPPWWESFHFQLLHPLVDTVDSSIFGAIFEFKPPFGSYNDMHGAPQYVIAFRGTILTGDSGLQDLRLDLDIIKNKLHRSPRSEIANQAVRWVVDMASEASNIWIAGHSLGSAIAILAGKDMARAGIFLEAFLFNPPFPSFSFRHMIRFARGLIKTRLELLRNGKHRGHTSAWLPSLFVHPGDHICSEYVGYFEKLVNQNSLRSVFFISGGNETKLLHLLPSATLMTNLTQAANLREAHGIQQWWKQNLHLQIKLYQ